MNATVEPKLGALVRGNKLPKGDPRARPHLNAIHLSRNEHEGNHETPFVFLNHEDARRRRVLSITGGQNKERQVGVKRARPPYLLRRSSGLS